MKSSDERCASLENQINLIQREIEVVSAQKERRLKLLKLAKDDVARMGESIATTFEAARSNPMAKRKVHALPGKQPDSTKGKGKLANKKKENGSEEHPTAAREEWENQDAEADSGLDEKPEEEPNIEVEAVDSNDDDDDEDDPMEEATAQHQEVDQMAD